MRKQFAIGDYNYKTVSKVIDMVNFNCDVANEPRIPIKIMHKDLGWFVECLNEADEIRLDKHLKYIYGITE